MSITIAHITDTHLDEAFLEEHSVDAKSRWMAILDDVVKKGITSVVFGGDIGEPSAHEWILHSLEERGLQTRFLLGNHDRYDVFKKHVSHPLPGNELYYGEDIGDCRHLFLDSSTEQVSQEQLLWLESQVQGQKRLLLFIHHPVLEVPTPVDQQYPLRNREEVKTILGRSGADVTIFCGHYHIHDFREEGRIRQFITPAASYQIVKDAPEIKMDTGGFGYRLITINDGSIETAVFTFGDNAFIASQPVRLSFPNPTA